MQMSLALCKMVNANVTPEGSHLLRTGEVWGWDARPGKGGILCFFQKGMIKK